MKPSKKIYSPAWFLKADVHDYRGASSLKIREEKHLGNEKKIQVFGEESWYLSSTHNTIHNRSYC